jgi:hypothetical protein
MKKYFQDAVDQSVDTSLSWMGELFRLRPFFVIALVIPSFVGLRWFTYSLDDQRDGAFPQIVGDMQSLKQLSEGCVSHGKQRIDVKLPGSGNPDDGRRRYEALRSDVSALIDKLKRAAPRGFTTADVAQIEQLQQRVRRSFVHLRNWTYGPNEYQTMNVLDGRSAQARLAQRHFSQPPEQLQAELEACRLVPWQQVPYFSSSAGGLGEARF